MIRLPAEWETQRQVLLSFPIQNGEWSHHLEPASRALATAAKQISRYCPVTVIVGDATHFSTYAAALTSERITVVNLPTDDAWIRDYGPITVMKNGRPLHLDFNFNGWGNRFPGPDNNALPRRLVSSLYREDQHRTVDLVLEGGSIETDGKGTLLTTRKCLLNSNRNSSFDQNQIEKTLEEELGVTRIIWLENGELEGDDTDAHVDTLVRFLDEKTIAYVSCTDENDDHYLSLKAMEREVKALKNLVGKPYKLVPLPLPPPIFSPDDDRRLPATYANFLISNGALFLPQYFGGKGADAGAMDILKANSSYEFVGIDCRPFLEMHGSIHCLTMQLPAMPIERILP